MGCNVSISMNGPIRPIQPQSGPAGHYFKTRSEPASESRLATGGPPVI